jgi:hypothetical protein
MENENNIKTFTAVDIEKYHKGLLSYKERHELEKAALEDLFLADAMEGYLVPGVNMENDIKELKKRLAEKTEQEKIIPITSRKTFPWFRAAAAVIIITGSALLANQFLFNKKSEDIAQVKNNETAPAKNESIKVTDSAITPSNTSSGLIEENTNEPGKEKAKTPEAKDLKGTTIVENNQATGGNNGVNEKISTDVTIAESKPAVPGNYKPAPEKTETPVVTGNTNDKDLTKVNNAKKALPAVITADENSEKAKEVAAQEADWYKKENRAVAANRKAEEQGYRDHRNNVFRGRVTDASNVGVPFANITNVEDNAGTYTDAKGNFILTSPDSVLTVQVRSIGFENNQTQLRNSLPTNQVVLQDDRRSLSEVVVSTQKPNVAARSRDANKTLEESEPADGWDNYDTYVANNLNVPEEVKYKQTNTNAVQVSFEVDKNGEPVNIRVEKKSLCATCDKEAIRLIKEGPKWKRNASKKGRTTVTINF